MGSHDLLAVITWKLCRACCRKFAKTATWATACSILAILCVIMWMSLRWGRPRQYSRERDLRRLGVRAGGWGVVGCDQEAIGTAVTCSHRAILKSNLDARKQERLINNMSISTGYLHRCYVWSFPYQYYIRYQGYINVPKILVTVSDCKSCPISYNGEYLIICHIYWGGSSGNAQWLHTRT